MSRKPLAIHIAIVLIVLGIQLRAIESFVLRPEATRILANVTGPGTDTPNGMVRQFVVDNAQIRKVVAPPVWVGWALLSGGIVLTIFALRKL